MGIRKILKESLSDFDWVGETDGLRNEKPKKGDTINVVYNGPRDHSSKNYFLAVLGKYRRPFKLGVFGKNIRGEVTEIGSEGYVLKEMNTGYEIYIPSPENIERQKEKAKKRVKKLGIPKSHFKFDFEFYHIVEPNSEPSVNEKFNMKLNKKTIKRILREEMGSFEWVKNVVPSNELKTKASEIEGKGYIWNFKDYEDFKKVFYELESLNSFKPPWAVSPHFEKSLGDNIKKYFGLYQETFGNFNIFLPYDRDNIYGWFDGQNEASDKNGEKVKTVDLVGY